MYFSQEIFFNCFMPVWKFLRVAINLAIFLKGQDPKCFNNLLFETSVIISLPLELIQTQNDEL